MMDDTHGVKEEANTSTKLADSMMESITTSVSKLRRGDMRPTIYKVPQRIRQGNGAIYEPQIVSIGPYHNGANKSLLGMEEHKWLYLSSFISRNPQHHLEDYIKAMEGMEDKARSCYSDNIGLQVGKEFVKMMVLDACFIVEYFLRFTNTINNILKELELQKEKELEQNEDIISLSAMDFFRHHEEFEDPILDSIEMASLIGYDMLLLENQIPFFVLQGIFKMACPVNAPHLLEKKALRFFNPFIPRNKKIEIKDNSYYHLLHLFHSHLLPTPTNRKEEPNLWCNPKIKSVLNKYLKNLLIIFLPCSNESMLPITKPKPKPLQKFPCATDLQLAGVKFKKNIEKSNTVLNVKFSHGVLEIPLLLIHYSSETLFRNLAAFEQCCLQPNIHVFTTYLFFMTFLLDTSKDVALLNRNGIIFNFGGSYDDVVNLFHKLNMGLFHDYSRSYLSGVEDELQKHCENKWNVVGELEARLFHQSMVCHFFDRGFHCPPAHLHPNILHRLSSLRKAVLVLDHYVLMV